MTEVTLLIFTRDNIDEASIIATNMQSVVREVFILDSSEPQKFEEMKGSLDPKWCVKARITTRQFGICETICRIPSKFRDDP